MRISFLRILKTNGPRGFNYKPLYYDEDKEDLDKRVRAIREEVRKEKEETGEVRNDHFRSRMQHAWIEQQQRERKSIDKRVFFIALVLSLLVYGFLYW